MSIKKVVLLGADGKLGPAILSALLQSGFHVTVLKRASSKSQDNYPSGVQVSRAPDDFPVDALVDVLQGQDAVVTTIKGTQTDIQYRLAQAAARAGVQRFIPSDFGSCDSSSAKTQEALPLYKHKTELREKLIRLAASHPAFSWTSLVCGHFFDWDPAFLHLDPRAKTADILDAGDTPCSASSLGRVADATARVLLRPDATANRMLYVQSFRASQNEVVAAFERVSGGSPWRVTRLDSDAYMRQEKVKAERGDDGARENVVWVLGTVDADWTAKEGFAMELLGLQDEALDELVREVMKGVS